MSSAREEILMRVRAATRAAAAPVIPREYRRAGTHSPEARTALFCSRVGEYRAEVDLIPDGNVARAVAAACQAHDAHRIGVPPALRAEWRPAGLELIQDDGLDATALDTLDGVLTGCTLAIAETGTIALAAADQDGRRALTLVPDLHVCIVEQARIVETVPEALAQLGPLVARTRRPLTLISGPSATSDIELSRVEGVHGPRKLVVIVLNRD